MTALVKWQNFYVIVGSSAGALIGLQFVALTFITATRRGRIEPNAGAAFSTPTIIHFGAALALSGILCAPWERIEGASATWGVLGAAGLLYMARVFRRIRKQAAYRPEFEDWLFHVLLPLAAYATLAASAFFAPLRLYGTLFAVGAASLVLLFTGIHNAWDAVTYHIFVKGTDDGPQR